MSKLGTVALKRGMILSNEPGYYRTGAYGIRIENLVLVTAGASGCGAEKPLNAFETLTLAPIDRRLIEPGLLTGRNRLARRLSRPRCRELGATRRRTGACMAQGRDRAAAAVRPSLTIRRRDLSVLIRSAPATSRRALVS